MVSSVPHSNFYNCNLPLSHAKDKKWLAHANKNTRHALLEQIQVYLVQHPAFLSGQFDPSRKVYKNGMKTVASLAVSLRPLLLRDTASRHTCHPATMAGIHG